MATLVSYWHADLDGSVHASQFVNQQHPAGTLSALPIALAAYRTAGDDGLDPDLAAQVWRMLVDPEEGIVREIHDRVGAAAVAEVLEAAECSAMTEIDPDGRSLTTVLDLSRILTGLGHRTLAPPPACAAIEEILAEHRHQDAIPLAVPEGVPLVNLTGGHTDPEVPGDAGESWHDMALVRPEDRPPFVMVVLTSGLVADEAEAKVLDVAAYLWDTMPTG